MRIRLSVLAIFAAAAGCGGGGPAKGPSLTVASYNLYLGADLDPLIAVLATGGDVSTEVAKVYTAMQATEPKERMDAVATQLAKTAPDVVALQEAVQWRTQMPADGAATPADNLAFDFLQELVDDLGRRGLTYTPVVTAVHTDIELTAGTGVGAFDVRLTDRDALLVKSGSPLVVSSVDHGTYTAILEVPTHSAGTIRVPRGWTSLDGSIAGHPLRLVNTHLEVTGDTIRAAQAAELIAQPASNAQIVLGDFNLTPGTATYDVIVKAGFVDGWHDSGDPGFTCCQADDLRNEMSQLDQRIDLLFTHGGAETPTMQRIGSDAADRTPTGLWPSDHAGIAATVQLP